MRKFLLADIEKFLRREGLSSFLPPSQDKTPLSITTIFLICLSVASVTVAFGKSFWIGFLIPIILLILYFLLLVIYLIIRMIFGIIRSRGKYNSEMVMSYYSPKKFGNGVIVLFMGIAPIAAGLYISSWLSAIITFAALIIVMLLTGLFLVNRDYWLLAIVEIIGQIFKGWILSWQAVLATTPILLVAILLSLFSGDLWKLMGQISITELTVLVLFVNIPVLIAIFAKIDLTDLTSHHFLPAATDVVDRVFSIPLIRKWKEQDLLVIEDRDDAISHLRWRDLHHSKELIANQLKHRIQRWYLLVILLTSFLLGVSFFLLFLVLFYYISPSLSQMGWLSTVATTNIIRDPIPQIAYFLASIQVAAFAASILDKPKENLLFKRTMEKATDWLTAIIVFQALYVPIFQIWETKEEAPWHKKLGVKTLRGKIVSLAAASDKDVNEACEIIENLFPRVQLIDLMIFKQSDNLTDKLRFGIEDFQWKYLNNRRLSIKQFSPIPFDLEIQEQHLLGREVLSSAKNIPPEWFGNNKINSEIGKLIWESDETHEIIMHPIVFGEENRVLHVSIHLFRRLLKSEDYSNLTDQVLSLVRQKAPNATLIAINLYFRSSLSSKIVADLQWTSDGQIFRKNELQKKRTFLSPLFSLFFWISRKRKKKK